MTLLARTRRVSSDVTEKDVTLFNPELDVKVGLQ
jgi:hypothetical protein